MEEVFRADALASLAQRHCHDLARLETKTKHALDMGRAVAHHDLYQRVGPDRARALIKSAQVETPLSRALRDLAMTKTGSDPVRAQELLALSKEAAGLWGAIGSGLARFGRGAANMGIRGANAGLRGVDTLGRGTLNALDSVGRAGYRAASTMGEGVVGGFRGMGQGMRRGWAQSGAVSRSMPRFTSQVQAAPQLRPLTGPRPAPAMPKTQITPRPQTQMWNAAAPPMGPGMGRTPLPAPPMSQSMGLGQNSMFGATGAATPQSMRMSRPMPPPIPADAFRFRGGLTPPPRFQTSDFAMPKLTHDRAATALLKLAQVVSRTDPGRALQILAMAGIEKDAGPMNLLGRGFGAVNRALTRGGAAIDRGIDATRSFWRGPTAGTAGKGFVNPFQGPAGQVQGGAVHFMAPTGNPLQRAQQAVQSRYARWQHGLVQDPGTGQITAQGSPLQRMKNRFMEGYNGQSPQPRAPVQAPAQGPFRTPEVPAGAPAAAGPAPGPAPGASAPNPGTAIVPRPGTPPVKKGPGLGLTLAGVAAPAAVMVGAPAAMNWMSAPQAPYQFGMNQFTPGFQGTPAVL